MTSVAGGVVFAVTASTRRRNVSASPVNLFTVNVEETMLASFKQHAFL